MAKTPKEALSALYELKIFELQRYHTNVVEAKAFCIERGMTMTTEVKGMEAVRVGLRALHHLLYNSPKASEADFRRWERLCGLSDDQLNVIDVPDLILAWTIATFDFIAE